MMCSCQKQKRDNVDPLDEIIKTYIDSNNIPGAEVLIWINGEMNYHKAFGFADIDNNIIRKINQPFRIASISKTFTALRILQMHDEGLICLDDSLSEYLPEFPNSDIITIRQLLNMNSGITDFADHEFLSKWYEDLDMEFSISEAVEMSGMKSDSFFTPGEKVVYSNVNYSILGLIIEKVTGNSIESEFDEHIFSALRLEKTVYPTVNTLPGTLRGYSFENDSFRDVTELNPSVPHTGGAVISCMSDMWIFVQALYDGSLLTAETHEQQMKALPMDKSPEWVRYGLGILDIGGFWGHNGTIFGFSSEMFYMPLKNAVIIINVNRLDKDDKSHSAGLLFKLIEYLFPDYVESMQR